MRYIKTITLAVVAMVSALSASAQDFEYEGLWYTVLDSEAKTVRTKEGNPYEMVPGNTVEGEIVIPATVSDGTNEYTVTMIGADGFKGLENPLYLTLPETIEKIAERAFRNCTGLVSINFPSSLQRIEGEAFNSCTSLLKAELSDNISYIGNRAFESCSAMEKVVLPGSLTFLDQYTFNSCPNLSEIVFAEGLEETSVGVFSGCAVTRLDLPQSLKKIGDGTFRECRSLKTINFPTTLPLEIGYRAFDNCGMETLVIPDNVVEIKGAFSACASLESVTLPSTMTELGESTFEGCENLKTVVFPSTLKKIGLSAFRFCKGLEHIDLPSSLEEIEASGFSECTGLLSAELPEGFTTLGANSFSYCEVMETLTLPSSLASMGEGVFDGCGLKNITYNAVNPVSAVASTFNNAEYENALLKMPNAALADVQATTPWNLFRHINAKDGSVAPALGSGTDFEYEGLWYTVLDSEAKTVRTKDGVADGMNPGVAANIAVGNLVIPATVTNEGIDYTVTEIGHTSFQSNPDLTSVVLPNTIQTIAWDAFYGCSALESVEIQEEVTKIEHGAFYECSTLTSLTLPASITSLDNEAFSGCLGLTTVTYNAETPIETSSYVFGFGNEIYRNATLNVPNATLASIQATEPWNLFRHINAKDGSYSAPLESGEDFEYEGIWYTVIDSEAKTVRTRAGSDEELRPGNTCTGELVIPSTVSDGINSYTVVEIGYKSFHNNTGLTSVTLPESVTEISGQAFELCSDLASVSFPGRLRIIQGSSFHQCGSLVSIALPQTLESLGQNAFDGCIKLEEVNYGASTPITSSDNIFSTETYNGAALNMPNAALADVQATTPWNQFLNIVAKDGEQHPALGSGVDFEYEGLWYTVIDPEAKTCKTKEGENASADVSHAPGNTWTGELVIPESASDGTNFYKVVEIGQSGFYGTEITSVTMPSSVTSIGNFAFNSCHNLTSVQFSDNITRIGGYAFRDCTGLTSVALPNVLTEVGESNFFGCTNLTEVTFPQGLTSIGVFAFCNCENLSNVTFPETLTSIGNYAFESCKSITSLSFPASVKEIGMEAFRTCHSLVSVTMSEGLEEVAEGAFYDCFNLASVTFSPNIRVIRHEAFTYTRALKSVSLPSALTEIGSSAFYGGGLEFLSLPESCVAIGDMAFMGCPLGSVSLPGSLNTIGSEVFRDCYGITDVSYVASAPISADGNVFMTDVYSNATLSMPNAALADVQATTPWNQFLRINAKDGSVAPALGSGVEFEYEGLWYEVVDPEAKTVRTRGGHESAGNTWTGDLVIPSIVSDGINDYTVTEIGALGFYNNVDITSITLPETVTLIYEYAFSGCSNVASLSLPESLKTINHGAFLRCENLVNLNLPATLESINASAFDSCKSITSITLPESVNLLGENAFWGCTSLSVVNLPASLPATDYGVFDYCNNITEVNYSATTPVASFAGLFGEITYNNATLNTPNAALADVQATTPWKLFKHIDAKDGSYSAPLGEGTDFEYEGLWYTVIDPEAKTVKTKEGTYDDNIPGWVAGNSVEGDIVIPSEVSDGSNDYTVVAIGNGGFAGLGITSVVMSNTVTSIGYSAFNRCTEMTSVVFSESLEAVEIDAFFGCEKLESLDLPNSLKVIGQNAFWRCTALESVKLPEYLTTILPLGFGDCPNLTEINFPATLTEIGSSAFQSCTGLTTLKLPESLTTLGEYAFKECSGLISIEIPSSVVEIGQSCFWGCNPEAVINYNAVSPVDASEDVFDSSMYQNATLNTPNATLADVQATTPWKLFGHIVAKDGSYTPTLAAGTDFEYDGLTYTVIDPVELTCRTKEGWFDDVTHPGNDRSGALTIPAAAVYDGHEYTVTEIGNAGFRGTGLTSVTLPTTINKIGESAFDSCQELTNVNLNTGLTEIGESAFTHCSALQQIEVPSTVTKIGGYTFSNCEILATVTLPEGLTELGDYSFSQCNALEAIKLPDTLTILARGTFNGCKNLVDVQLPASLVSIESNAFVGCDKLSGISFPETLKSIGGGAFAYCDMRSLIFHESLEVIEELGFSENNHLEYVELPASLIALGENAFAGCSNIVGIEYNAANPIPASENTFAAAAYENAMLEMPNAALADVKATSPWNLFAKITAKDGNTLEPGVGEEITTDGIVYVVTDTDAHLVKTKDGSGTTAPGNYAEGDLEIPAQITVDDLTYTVTEIGRYGFCDSPELTSVTFPETIGKIGTNAFANCERLTSLVWHGRYKMDEEVIDAIGNRNLIVYADSMQYAPKYSNSVDMSEDTPLCHDLVIWQGDPFRPLLPFVTVQAALTKEYWQGTPIDGCAGWETIVLPFDVTKIESFTEEGGSKQLVPFAAVTDIYEEYPFWLYEADAEGEWKEATEMKAGKPYIVSMPNNPDYDPHYNVAGRVTYSNDEPTIISQENTAPQITTWASGREFTPLWMPLHDFEAEEALGLNVDIEGLTDDEGEPLAPGSAFSIEVMPTPLEVYVTSHDGRSVFKIGGEQNSLPMLTTSGDLDILTGEGEIRLLSSRDRRVVIFNTVGIAVKTLDLKAGLPATVDGLTRDIYIVAGRKITVK